MIGRCGKRGVTSARLHVRVISLVCFYLLYVSISHVVFTLRLFCFGTIKLVSDVDHLISISLSLSLSFSSYASMPLASVFLFILHSWC